MTLFDWAIVGATIIGSLVVGLWFSRRASRTGEDFFVASRSMGWLLAGTSMVATTFSADTPLFVTGLVREQGIFANWIWWAMVPAALGTTFFFARLWRRSGAITEVEFLIQRYDDGPGVRVLRVIRALFDGAFTNAIIIASVTLAMSKITLVILEVPAGSSVTLPLFGAAPLELILVGAVSLIALVYTAASGLYGVIYTDFVQFCVAMLGATILAGIVYVDLGGGSAFVDAVTASPDFREGATLSMVPALSSFSLETVSFLILISISWIGATPGSGHFVQRILATRTERDAMLSMYWYAFTNYVLRSWPWIVTALASLVYFPNITDAEQAYPAVANAALPAGLKGLMVASLVSAFMSTLSTQLNWGTSYLINDVYKPYVLPGRTPHHYVTAGRVSMLILAGLSVYVGTHLDSIVATAKYLAVMTAGAAFLAVARWYWWRIGVYSEIASISSSLVVGISLFWILPDEPGADRFALRLAVNMALTTLIVIIVSIVTSRRGPTPQTVEFYKRLRVSGRGWRRVQEMTGLAPQSGDLRNATAAWLSSIAVLYALLFGIGHAIFAQWSSVAISIAVGAIGLWGLGRTMPKTLREISDLRNN